MASTSSSLKACSIRLILRDPRNPSAPLSFEMHEGRRTPGLGEIDYSAAIVDRAQYELSLFTDCNLGAVKIMLRINEDEHQWRCIMPEQAGSSYVYRLVPTNENNNWRPFSDTYGFATVEARIHSCQRLFEPFTVKTKEIPCSSTISNQRQYVVKLLDELAGQELATPIGWMLSAGNTQDSDSLGDAEGSEANSLQSFVLLTETILAGIEAELPNFKTRPCTKTDRSEQLVAAEKLRQIGRNEIEWLYKNSDRLFPVRQNTAIHMQGRNWYSRKIQTKQTVRSCDTYENRAVVSFISHVSRTLAQVIAGINQKLDALHEAKNRLSGIQGTEGHLIPVMVIDAQIERDQPLLSKLQAQRTRAQRFYRLLSEAMPVAVSNTFRMPRKTKIFQEIPHYARLFQLMRMWDAFGEFDFAREGLILSMHRVSRLYELYSLASLLRWFDCQGYTPDSSYETPFERVERTQEYGMPDNEREVANVYRLQRGSEQVTLWYQPVLYGGDQEFAGLGAHRLLANDLFDQQPNDSYWTPDFALSIKDTGRDSLFLLDSKFTSIENAKEQRFNPCLTKYRLRTIRSNGMPIDSVWLLCGQAPEPTCVPTGAMSWARQQGIPPIGGLAALSPFGNSIDQMMQCLGIAKGATIENVMQAAEKVVEVSPEPQWEPFAATSAMPENPAVPVQVEIEQVVEPDPAEPAREPEPEPEESIEVSAVVEAEPVVEATDAVKAPSEEAGAANPTEPDKPAKPKKEKKRKPKSKAKPKRPAGPAIDTAEVRRMLLQIIDGTPDRRALYDQRCSFDTLGISHPLLRDKMPAGREGKFYDAEPISVDGKDAFVFKAWTPMNVNQIKRACARLAKERAGD